MYTYRAASRRLPISLLPSPTSRALHATVRRRAVEDPPLSHSTPPKGRSPWPIVIGLTALLGGSYAYYSKAESNRIDERKGEFERRAATPGAIAEEAKERIKEAAADGRAQSASLRESAEAKIAAAKSAAANTYEDGKARVDSAAVATHKKVEEAKQATEKTANDAKQTWSSWLGWGKDKTTQVAEDLKRKANESEEQFSRRWEETKALAKAKGEEVAQRVGETEEQYRIRIARAVSRKDK